MSIVESVIYMLDYVWNTLFLKDYLPNINFKVIFIGLWIMAIGMNALRNLMNDDIDISGI